MKVLVTGASGNVGSFVVKELLNRGEKVVATTTNIQKINKLFGNEVEPIFFNFTDKNTFNKALEGVDRVFLMRPPHLGKPEYLYPFIDAMKAHDIKLVSFLSLMEWNITQYLLIIKLKNILKNQRFHMPIFAQDSLCRIYQEFILLK